MDIKIYTVDDKADPTFNQLLGINNNGVIAGYFGSGQPGHPNKGYTLKPGYTQNDYHNENVPGSMQTQVTGLNNDDRTVGFEVDSNGNQLGFVEHDGVFSVVYDPNLPPPASSPNGTPITEQFLGINDANFAVGFYTDAHGQNHGFAYDVKNQNFYSVGPSSFSNVTVAAINDKFDIAGFGTYNGKTVGFVEDSHGHTTVLNGPAGASNVQALGVNDNNEVVGSYQDAAGNTHGFLYELDKGRYTTIDAGAKTETVINGLNDKDEIVGFYMDAAGNTHGLLAQVSNRS
ncbi:MAG TPA: hypothetical protein VE690_19900 [Rhodopila sp.]|nr:hypothetical protein [Rhodopila sp.]